MVKTKEISEDVRKLIIRAVQEKKSHREVATLFGVSKTSVTNLLKRFRERNNVQNKPRSGRPKVTTERDDKILVRMSKRDPRKTAVELNETIQKEHAVKCSVSTTKRRLCKAGLFGRRPAKKPLISVKNRKARLKFAKDHLNWTSKEWSKVLWSDESKFMVFESDGIKYVRRPEGQRFNPKYQLPTVKHGGGSVMVWGAFSRDMVGPIHRINGIMDQVVYKDIIANKMLPFAKDKMPRGWIFQQDNDPKHTAKSIKEFFKNKKIRLLEWPSQSPDLNPIEHLWEHIDRKMKGNRPRNKEELFNNINECWQNIPLDVIIKLVDSMPSRCKAVIAARGYATKY